MDNKPNRKCRICGAAYHACMDCAARQRARYGVEPWRAIAESPLHYQVYSLLIDYTRKAQPVSEIKIELQRLHLTDVDTYLPENRKLVEEILAYQEPESSAPEKELPPAKPAKTRKAPKASDAVAGD